MLTQEGREILAAARLEHVHYAIRDLAVVADALVAKGAKILYLNVGDPMKFDFVTPPHMVEAVYKAMRDGHNGYAGSMGIPDALSSIRVDAEKKGIRDIHSIFVTNGASEAVDVCLAALLNAGDNLLTPNPEYPLYSAVVAKLEAKLNPYALDESNGWQPDLDAIERQVNPRTRGIVIINPNNPTGAVYSRKTLEKIADIARRNNLVIFADEIYDKLLLDGDEHLSIAALAPDVPCITFGGLSKNYLVPGWRVGWGIASGSASAIKPYLEGVHQLLRARLCSAHPPQFAIKPALEGPQDHLAVVRKKLKARRDLTQKWADETPGVSLVAPKGAFYAFPKIEIDYDDKKWVTDLLTEKHVLLVHGSGFGQAPGTHHARIVFLPDEATLSKAYASMAEFMRK